MGTRDELSAEYGKMMTALDSVKAALSWNITKTNETLTSSLNKLLSRARAHEEDIELMNEAEAAIRQNEIQNQNSSWFVADAIINDYQTLTRGITPPSTAKPLVNPKSGKCLDIYGGGTAPSYPADESQAQLFTCNGGDNQQWMLQGKSVVNAASGK